MAKAVGMKSTWEAPMHTFSPTVKGRGGGYFTETILKNRKPFHNINIGIQVIER